jgi:hypothetical protein
MVGGWKIRVISCAFSFECRHLASFRPIAWGMGVVFLSVFRLLARWIHLESLVQIGYVAPGLLSRLSSCDGMIPDEWIEVNDNLVGVCASRCGCV